MVNEIEQHDGSLEEDGLYGNPVIQAEGDFYSAILMKLASERDI